MSKHTLILALALVFGCQTTENDDVLPPEIVDKDEDGFAFEDDCNDSDASIYPGAPESCEEPLVDSNCDGSVGGLDEDEDGFRACDDCDDLNAERNPVATEICDEIDNDCDGDIDDQDSNVDLSTAMTFYADSDNDGFGDPEQPIVQCATPEQSSENMDDCNDEDAEINPNADEVCDYQDNNCDGLADRDDTGVILTDEDPICFPDADADGYGDDSEEGLHTCFCTTGEIDNQEDCNDEDNNIHPDRDFSEIPADDGSWDLNCDGNEEKQHEDTGGYCSLSSDARMCDFGAGYIEEKAPECGNSALYITACLAKKSTTGMYCEQTDETRIQSCR